MKRTILLIGIIAAATGLCVAEEIDMLGDHTDGSRSRPVHLIELYDADGQRIRAADADPRPFSMRQTCGQCHTYETISQGWHFNAHDPEVPAGRPSQPWVLSHLRARTQIPISGRGWAGTFTPEQIGLSPWEFMNHFGMYHPGGSYGEMEADDPEHFIRQDISGTYEINCLMCHHPDFRQDPSETAMQIARQNYRWAAAGGSGKAAIKGVAMELSMFFDPEFDEGLQTIYRDGVFDEDDLVYFDIVGKTENHQCYHCHSYQDLRVDEDDEWTRDKDVHLAAGMSCTDCHRHGHDHMISRGVEGADGDAATLSCSGCHLGLDEEQIPLAGRLGAPRPRHPGIPPIHFEKMNCTACHSGTWPDDKPGRWRSSRIHRLGLHDRHRIDLRLPHIYAPVLLKGDDGKIGSHYLMWPAFWATMRDDEVTPMLPETVMDAASGILGAAVEPEDNWRPLTEEQVGQVLAQLAAAQPEDGQAVYIAGGKLYHLDGDGDVQTVSHEAAGAYAWPMGHDVRPAQRALGVRGCADCHTTDAAFSFANVEMDTPVQGDMQFVQMVELQGIDHLYMKLFNASFVFRPVLKVVAYAACGVIGLVLLMYGLKALVVISRACAQEAE